MNSIIIILVVIAVCKGTNIYDKLRTLEPKQSTEGLQLPTYSDWLKIPPYLQSVLISIDDKLRGLETFSHTLRLAKLDFSLEQLVRRLDSIETKLGTLQTKFDQKIEKVEETVIAKDIKEDFSNDHLSRGINGITEKLNNKFVLVEAKLDLASERLINRIGQLERTLQTSFNKILGRLAKIEERQENIENESKLQGEKINHVKVEVNRVKMLVKDDVMSLLVIKTDELRENIKTGMHEITTQGNQAAKEITELKHGVSQMQQVPHQVNKTIHKITSSVKQIINGSLRCSSRRDDDRGKGASYFHDSDGILSNITAALQKVSQDRSQQLNNLDSDLNHFMMKVYNGIQELWRSSDLTKMQLEKAMKESNATRDYFRDEFSNIRKEVAPISALQPQALRFQRILNRKLQTLGQSVDKNFEIMLIAQNQFISSCQQMLKVQEELPTITLILHSMLVEIRNRTDIQQLHRFVNASNLKISDSLERLQRTIDSLQQD